MKKKILFFVLQGFLATNKEHAYFDVYRAQAEEYIKSSPEILEKYQDGISVKFDNSVTYQRNTKRTLIDKFVYIFSPDVPETIEEFSANIKMIKFNTRINGDAYEVIFEKNDNGELYVSRLTPVVK